MRLNRRQFLATVGTVAAVSPALARIGAIEIGVVKPAAEFAEALRAGFDYFEPPAFEIADMSEARFTQFKDQVLASPIRCTHLNFLIQKLHVVGEDVNPDALRKYIDLTLDRSQALGGRIIVFGSAVTRRVPEGFSRDRAWQQIATFLRMCDPMARARGITIAVEPIRYSSSNILSTGEETLKMIHEVNLPNIRMMIDFFQMRSMNESPDIVWKARDFIVHLHLANVEPHTWPKDQSGDPQYSAFFAQIKKIGYKGALSIEAGEPIAENAPATFAFLKKMLA